MCRILSTLWDSKSLDACAQVAADHFSGLLDPTIPRWVSRRNSVQGRIGKRRIKSEHDKRRTMYPDDKALHPRPIAEGSIRPIVRSIGLCAAVLVLEPIVLAFLTHCFPLPPFEEGLAEAAVILTFLVPGLYFGLIRPFQGQIEYGRQLAAGLEATRNHLEDRVVERSAELSSANTKLHGSLLKLKRRHNELVVLREMGALLQACTDVNEAEDLLKIFSQKLFPEESGAVYLYRSSRNLLERTVAWGESAYAMSLEPEDCWALRCGEACGP